MGCGSVVGACAPATAGAIPAAVPSGAGSPMSSACSVIRRVGLKCGSVTRVLACLCEDETDSAPDFALRVAMASIRYSDAASAIASSAFGRWAVAAWIVCLWYAVYWFLSTTSRPHRPLATVRDCSVTTGILIHHQQYDARSSRNDSSNGALDAALALLAGFSRRAYSRFFNPPQFVQGSKRMERAGD